MNNLEKSEMPDLIRRLDVLIFLSLDNKYPSVTDKVKKLTETGLNSGEIGRILGKATNYVTATLSKGKKRKKTKEAR